MQLVHFGIEFEFDETTEPNSPAHKVFDAFGGKTPKIKPTEPGVSVKSEQQKFEINWKYERCRIRTEDTDDRNKCISTITKLLEMIDNTVPIGKLQNTQIYTEWILSSKLHDFASLNEIYMRKLISPKKFMRGTYDSSVVLDSRVDDFILHHQSGPMMQKQLSEQYLGFKRANLPKELIFLIISARYQKVIQYNRKDMHRFIENALSLCERHSNEFGKIWEGLI